MLLREYLRRVWYLLNRRRIDEALRQEMEAHRAEMGQPARFGNMLRLREESRDVWGWNWLDGLSRDTVLALRTLRRAPLFTFTAVTILAVGIGVNLAFFHLVSTTLLQPPAIKDPQTVAQFYRRSEGSRSSSVPAPLADFVSQHNRALSAVLTSASRFLTWGDDGGRQIEAAFVSANWFDELGATAETGQLFHANAADAAAGASPPFIVLSYELWQRDFGGRADVAGTIVRINDRPATVLGVVGRRFAGVDFARPSVWVPIQHIDLFFNPAKRFELDWNNRVELFGRFRPGVTPSSAEDELSAVMAALSRERPDQVQAQEWLQAYLGTDRFMNATDRQEVFTIVAAVGGLTMLVLIIACLNLSNLMLARAVARVRETSIRSALGANRWQAMRHLALEGAILSAVGGAAGLLVGVAAASVLATLTALPASIEVTPDWRTTLACLGTVALAAVTVGALPAWKVARRDLAFAARDGGERASEGLQSTRLRSWLVAGQVAGCGVLLVFAGHMQRGLDRLLTRDVGFSFEQVAVMDASLAAYGLDTAAGRGYWSSVLEIVRAHPAVDEAGLVDNPPLGPTRNESRWSSAPGLSVSRHAVEPGFFSLMRIPILLGRTFQPGDDPAAVVIISETVATRMYGRREVIGREFPRDDRDSQRRIVGITRDAHLHEPHATNAGEQYTVLSPDEAGSALLLVRARSDAARVVGPMRQASRSVAAQIAPATRLMREDFAQTVLAPSVARSVAAAIAMLALVMAALGIAGLVSYVARLRTKEMGIRMALGASTGAILRALLGRTGAVALVGAVLGLAGGWAAGHVFAGNPFYLKPLDVLPYASAALTLSLSVSAAALLPAIRVLHTDLLRALRVD